MFSLHFVPRFGFLLHRWFFCLFVLFFKNANKSKLLHLYIHCNLFGILFVCFHSYLPPIGLSCPSIMFWIWPAYFLLAIKQKKGENASHNFLFCWMRQGPILSFMINYKQGDFRMVQILNKQNRLLFLNFGPLKMSKPRIPQPAGGGRIMGKL